MADKTEGILAPDREVPALKLVGEVQSLNIQSPQDVILIKLTFPIGAAATEQLISTWKQVTKLPNPVIAIIDGMDVKVIRPKGAQ